MNVRHYVNESGEAIFVPSIVCYADILGWKRNTEDAIKSGQGSTYLRMVRQTLSFAYDELRKMTAPVTQTDPPFFDIKIFTDNVAIAFPSLGSSRRFAEPALVHMFFVFSRFQAVLARNGFFLRGAVAFGNHYQDKDFVLGDALLEAVENEKKGDPPRIVLGPSIEEIMKEHVMKYGGHIRNTPHFSSLFMDTDGRLFLDYLSNAFGAFPDGPIFFDLLRDHREKINAGLIRYRKDPDILRKYKWLASYHNFVCKHFMAENPLPWDPDEEDYARAEEVEKLSKFLVKSDEEFQEPTHIGFWWERICRESGR
jgi:hypothetical protein